MANRHNGQIFCRAATKDQSFAYSSSHVNVLDPNKEQTCVNKIYLDIMIVSSFNWTVECPAFQRSYMRRMLLRFSFSLQLGHKISMSHLRICDRS